MPTHADADVCVPEDPPAARPFRRRAFRQWYLATTLLAVSTSTTLAVTLALVDVLGSVAMAGLVTGSTIAVELVVGAVGGGLADIVSRRVLLRRALVMGLLANVVLAGVLGGLALVRVEASPWVAGVVITALVVSAGAAGIADPVLDASARSLITPAEFPRAMSAEHARSSTLQLVGGPASGGMYALASSAPFVLRVLCDLGFLVILGHIRQELGPPRAGTDRPVTGDRMGGTLRRAITGYREALLFLLGHSALRRVMLTAPLVNLMVFSGTSWTVLHLAAAREDGLITGLTVSGFAVGGLVGSVVAPVLTDRMAPGILSIAGLGWMTAAFAGLFLAGGRPWLLFAIAVLAMLPSPALNGGLFGHVFAETPDGMQGRVMAALGLVGGLASVLAPPLAGFAVQGGRDMMLGTVTCVVGALGVLVLASSPHVRAMPRP